MTSLGTKYPVGAPPETGIEDLRRLELFTELGMVSSEEQRATFGEIALSAHAPLYDGEIRLNIASTDDDFRDKSMRMILEYIDRVRDLPNLKKINMHPAPRRWLYEDHPGWREGDYGRMIDGIREIAEYVAGSDLEVVLENNTSRWEGIPDDIPAEDVDWTSKTVSYGSAPEEWAQVCEDVDRPNVWLCLDSSHACTYAHTIADEDKRADVLMAYLAKPHLIRHVHWNDNYVYDLRGRNDSHALLGKGTMPAEFHRAIKALDATLMIEHFYGIEELEEELGYIAQL